MLAKSTAALPRADATPAGYAYEPKWDGFRCIVFRDGDDVVLGSRNTKPLTRYFPEVVDAVRELLPPRCVLDGELIVVQGERLEFERLLDRIHPADSRVRMLAETTPAAYVAFDLLALGTTRTSTSRSRSAGRPWKPPSPTSALPST
jgi:ATP-dependent DNA ligase